MNEVITIGEPMVLFVADTVGPLADIGHFTKFLAGAEVNVAIGLARLDHRVTYITKLGQDPLGQYIEKFLSGERINTTYVKFDPNNPTGFQMKEKVLEGDPEVVSFRRGSAASRVCPEDLVGVDLTGVKHIHLTGIPLALSSDFCRAVFALVAEARVRKIRLTFDPNLRPKLWASQEEMIRVINELAGQCDFILPGINEGKLLTGHADPEKIADFYLDRGVNAVLIKLGEKGAYVKTATESYLVPGFPVDRVIDTVGAGDGFAVGVISALLEGLPLPEAVRRGNAIGSLQVMTPGDNDGLPNRDTLAAYLAKTGLEENITHRGIERENSSGLGSGKPGTRN